MFCSSCGKESIAGQRFCGGCGTELVGSALSPLQAQRLPTPTPPPAVPTSSVSPRGAKASRAVFVGIAVGLLGAAILLGVAYWPDPVQKDIISYLNVELPKVAALESEAIAAYNEVWQRQDDAEIFEALQTVIIPKYREFSGKLSSIRPATPEVRALHARYVEAASVQMNGFLQLLPGIQTQDLSVVLGAREKVDQGAREIARWKADLDALCKQHNVLRGAGSAELSLAPSRVESSRPPAGIIKSGQASSDASAVGLGSKGTPKEECAAYEPAVTVAQGILRRKTFPGPPNYEDIAKGDEPETGFYLELARPLCVKGEQGEEAGYGPIEDVSLLQLILDKDGYDRYREHLDQPVTISGGLSPGFNGHHHAPLLLQPK